MNTEVVSFYGYGGPFRSDYVVTACSNSQTKSSKMTTTSEVIVCDYMGDLTITASHMLVIEVKKTLSMRLKMKYIGESNYIFEMEFNGTEIRNNL